MKNLLLLLLLFLSLQSLSQDSLSPGKKAPVYAARQWAVGGLTVAGYGGSFLFLTTAWYSEHQKTSLHTFNDAGEWLQVDKVGHAWTTYHTSRITTDLWRWAGVDKKKAIWLGTGSSFLYMLSIEYLDGRSAKWGWSWADVGANAAGALLFAAQQRSWGEQKLSLKFSSHVKAYTEPDLQQRADILFGSSYQGRLLKDYNAQTYWLSANLSSFMPSVTLPQWLNLAIGYGGEGMFGGFENVAKDKNGVLTFNRKDIKRNRQWYLAPDVDFTKIKTNSKAVRTILSALNVIKFPAPALEFSKGKLKLKALAY